MNNIERKERALNLFKTMMSDAKSKTAFIDNPTLSLVNNNIITTSEAEIQEVQDFYISLAQNLKDLQPEKDTDGTILKSFWGDAACWSCKIGLGAVVAAAVAAATIASGGFAVPAIAAALGISEAAVTVAVAAAGGGATKLVSLLLTEICGKC
jgi:hypothetical protein